MIVGALTLITLLFGSGSFELFFIHDFEKGVKEIVVEKDRKKEILSDIKEVKSVAKEFEKLRKAEFKDFKELNTSRTASADDFMIFFTELQLQRVTHQSNISEFRVAINKKLEQPEWNSILAFSKKSIEEEIAKAQKKKEKKKDKPKQKPFEKTRETLTEVITDSEKENIIIAQLDELVNDMDKLQKDVNRMFADHEDILSQKDALKIDLQSISKGVNKVRKEFYDELTSFHFVLKENTNDEEWITIIKIFNKELSLMNK